MKHYYSPQPTWANYKVLLNMETRLVKASQLQTFQPLLTCPTLLVSEAVMTAYGLSQGGALQEETGRALPSRAAVMCHALFASLNAFLCPVLQATSLLPSGKPGGEKSLI